MARQSRGRSSSSSRAAPAQTRTASTAAAPAGYAGTPARAPAPPAAAPSAASAGAADKQPGMLAQMAATAGSVAIGSTIGHGLSSMLFGGGGNQAAEQEAPPAQQQQQRAGMSCEIPAKDFTMCLEKADMPSCTYYLEQLKACQAAAAPY